MDISYYKKYEPIFGYWKIVREIGSGSFGKVFEIEREDFGYTYKAALKAITIPQDPTEAERLMDDSMDEQNVTKYYRGFVQELVDEFQLMSRLKGETNIVSYEDHKVIPHEDGIGWDILIRMELLTPLPKYAKKHGMSQADVVRLGIDICKALEICRRHGIIHRDIKPDNIFVSERGNFKLGDFGIARTVEKTMSNLSKKGTYNYMAPEVYNGSDYGPSVDIYSLGIVLYRYLNNNRFPFLPQPPEPFSHNDLTTALARRSKGEALPSPVNAGEKLAAIVLKACAYDPKERYASATEMREALEALAVEPAAEPEPAAPIDGDATVSVQGKTGTVLLNTDTTATIGMFGAAGAAQTVSFMNGTPAADTTTTMLTGDFDYQAEQSTQADTKWSTPKTTVVKEPAAPKSDKKFNKKHLAAAAVIAVVIALGAVAFGSAGGSSSPVVGAESSGTPDDGTKSQTTWSDWSEDLPSAVSKAEYSVEEQTLYRSRDKQTKTSTSSSKMDGWTLEETVDKGEYGAWSDWSRTKVNSSDTREVDKETRYRSRSLDTTTSSNSSLDGWELADTTYSWGDYGAWSDWSTTAVSSSDSRKVETQTQYRYRSKSTSQQYTAWSDWSGWSTNSVSSSSTKEVQTRTVYGYYYFSCKYCGAHMHYWGNNVCYTWMGGCGRSNAVYSDSFSVVWSTTPWSQATDPEKTGHAHIGSKPNYLFVWSDCGTATQYRYRTRSLQNVTNYGSWSGWSTSAVSSSSTRDVQTRTVYRYCDRHQVATYHFQRWGDWSNWTTQKLTASATTQVDSATFYRYRDKASKKTYIFSRWSDWSEWSETPAYKSDTKQVETKTVYRYRAK